MAKGNSRVRLQVAVTDARGRPIAAGGLGRWLVQAAPAKARGRVTIALVSNGVMRRLNRDFRRADYATDVLSFQASGPPGPKAKGLGRDLGDIAIATQVARRQAAQHGHSQGAELRILALHGLLHLLGYDHETDRGQMRTLEERLRRRAGLPVGVTSRAPGRHSRR